MSSIDNLIAFKVLYMLVQPFDKTEAYKLGVIDKDGKLLVPTKDQTPQQKNAYNYLDRLVINLKRLLAKVPGGSSKFASMVAALYLIKEDTKLTNKQLEEKFNDIIEKLEQQKITLVEEELVVEDFLSLLEEVGAAPANVTGAGVSTDIPVIKSGKKNRKYASFEVDATVLKRFSKGKKKFTKWSEYLDLSDPKQAEVYYYAKKNPKGVLVLKSGDMTKAIRYNRNGGGKWHKVQRRSKPQAIIQTEDL